MSEDQVRQLGILESLADEPTREKLFKGREQMFAKVRKKLKVSRETVRRYQKRSDLYISTLRSYVEGVGGKLSLVVEFPDQAPVILAGLGMDEGKPKKSLRKKAKLASKRDVSVKPSVKLRSEISTKSGAKLRKSA